MPTAGHRTSDASARSRPRTEALRLSAIVHPAAPGRRTVRDQPHLPALPRRGPDGAQAAVAAARSGTRAPIVVEAAANARWSLDFVHDQLACGRHPHPEHRRRRDARCLAAIPDTSISGRRVARELTALIERRGKPGMIVSDNGTEFTSNAVFAWAHDNRVVWHFIAPGKPMQTASARFNGACATSFSTRACSSASIMRDQGSRLSRLHQRRPHSALGYLTPTTMPPISPTRDRLRNPDQLRRSHVSTRAPRRKPAEALIAAG